MKRVFAIWFPEDGLGDCVYTNIRAVYKALVDSEYYLLNVEGKKFNYSSLLSTIRYAQDSNRKCVAIIETSVSRDTLRVYELELKTR